MATYFLWGSIGLIVFAMLIAFLVGMYRGLKRSATHVIFVLVSVVVAFFVTRPITNAILGVNINFEGTLMTISDYIVKMISDNFVDLSNFDSASAFVKQLPGAIASPIVFIVVMLLMLLLFEIFYLITARISFGTKKKDFSANKPHRLPGGFIAMAETFMFLLVLFAPITSLAHTYEELAVASATVSTQAENENTMPTISEQLSGMLPKEVTEAVVAFNDSAFGVICSAGGFDDALFDGLSNVKIDGEKINVRKEIVTLASTYDEVAVFVNDVNANNFEELNFKPLKESLVKVLKNNLFKTVVTDTLGDFIVKFDDVSAQLNLSVPEEVKGLIYDLQAKFVEGFDFYTYLTEDIIDVLDIVDNVITSGTLKDYLAIENVGIESVLNLVVNKEETVSSSLKSALTLNVVTDTLPRIVDILSAELKKAFENNENIGLNNSLSKEDMEAMVDSLMNVAKEVKALNDENDLFALVESEDIVSELLQIENIGTVLDDLGGVLDEAHSLKILNFTKDNVTHNTLDEILETMGLVLLGDDVHNAEGEMVTIDSYGDLFAHIKTPVELIVNAKLTGILQEGTDFDAVLDVIKAEVQKDNEFLAKVMMPFYDLEATTFNGESLKTMVFDNIIDSLSESLDGFIALKAGEDIYENYYAKLSSIGELLDEFSSNTIEVVEGEETKTYDYLEYVMTNNADYVALITDMQAKSNEGNDVIGNILTILFENEMYKPLYDSVFPSIDSALGEVTGVAPVTDYSNINADGMGEKYITVIKALLNLINDESAEGDDIIAKLPAIGKVLDALKVSAQDEVFKDVFVNIIWYLTGDVIDKDLESLYAGKTPDSVGAISNGEYQRVKKYFGVTDVENGYYTISYEAVMADLASVIDLAKELSTNLENITIESVEDVANFANAVKNTVETLYSNGDGTIDVAKAVEVVESAVKLAESFVDEETLTQYANEITTALDTAFNDIDETEREELTSAIEALLGIKGEESGI